MRSISLLLLGLLLSLSVGAQVTGGRPINGSQIVGPVGPVDASAATVLSSGSTTARTEAARATDQISAFDYGCAAVVNNSSSDAGPCIQATFNAAFSKNRTAHFPGGIYYIASPVSCPVHGVDVLGDGWNLQYQQRGTWFHVVSVNFMTGGASAGTPPITCSTPNSTLWSNIAFTEDQPADTNGWTPNDYGPLILLTGMKNPRFSNIYIGLVNKFMDVQNANGLWLDHFSGQVTTYAFLIEQNADYMHAEHFHFNDFTCSTGPCPNITLYGQNNAVGFQSNRNDSPTFVDIQAYGLNSLFTFGTQSTGPFTGVTTKAVIEGADCDKCYAAISVTGTASTVFANHVIAHGTNFAGNGYLQGSSLLNISSNNSQISLDASQSDISGDSAIVISGTGNTLRINNLLANGWGENPTSGTACLAANPALNFGTGNTVLATQMSFVPGAACSTTTYAANPGVSNGELNTWTPVLEFGGATTGITYSTQGGVYQVNYHEVILQFGMTLTSKGSATGTATIHNLPIAANGSGTWGAAGSGSCSTMTNMASLTSDVILQLPASGTTFNMLENGSSGTSNLADTNFTNTTALRCTFRYMQ